ncbi:alpha/beta fold hydrolase [Rhodosalinus sp. K401]|uniref:alpha/beta fold hydrolase n=1 Tax=Rhodosalinus sp. K401 TaxID=3239195 RepID=UPI0035233FB2
MTLVSDLRARIEAASGDSELRHNSPGLEVAVRLEVEDASISIQLSGGDVRVFDEVAPDIVIAGTRAGWSAVVTAPQPPLHNSFTALQLANPAFEVAGEPLKIAQARAALDRLIECIAPVMATEASAFESDLSQVSGKYVDLDTQGGHCRVYYETAGESGVPLVFLHTAGADGRQYLEQMADCELASRFRLFAPDMPYHGRSMPPRDWDGEPYCLTSVVYLAWLTDFVETVIGEPAIYVGGSMGAAIALTMAAQRPNMTYGVVALEPPFQSKGRQNPFQNHVCVHAGLHNSAFTRGLMSPSSPIDHRRVASWIYTQGAPGVYYGDLAFYSEEFDGAEIGPLIDASSTPVALLSGVYDFSATPEDGAKLASTIPGALHIVMDRLGHFPATEHPALFRPHLMRGIEHVTNQRVTK